MNNNISNKLYMLAIISLILGLISYFTLDKSLAIYLNELHYPPWFERILLFIEYWSKETRIAYGIILLVVVLGINVLIGNYYSAKKMAFVVLCFVLACLITFAIKVILARARPELLVSQHIYGLTWFSTTHNLNSMPSGHTSINFSIALSVICVLRNKAIQALLVFTAICIALDRVLIIHHYLGDILIGIAVACFSVGLSYQLFFNHLTRSA